MAVVLRLPCLLSPANTASPLAKCPSETDWTRTRQSYHYLHGVIIHDSLLRIWAWLWCSRVFGLKFWGFGGVTRPGDD